MDRDIVVHRLDAKVSHRPSEPVCAPALPGHRTYGTDIGSRSDGRAGLRGAGRPLVVGGACRTRSGGTGVGHAGKQLPAAPPVETRVVRRLRPCPRIRRPAASTPVRTPQAAGPAVWSARQPSPLRIATAQGMVSSFRAWVGTPVRSPTMHTWNTWTDGRTRDGSRAGPVQRRIVGAVPVGMEQETGVASEVLTAVIRHGFSPPLPHRPAPRAAPALRRPCT